MGPLSLAELVPLLLTALVGGALAAAVSGGLLCVGGVALVGLALPALRRYDARAGQRPRTAPMARVEA